MSFNHLRTLPAALSSLTALTELDARANSLTVLNGTTLAAWKALTRLSLHRNDLTELPDTFAGLSNLSVLDCRCGV